MSLLPSTARHTMTSASVLLHLEQLSLRAGDAPLAVELQDLTGGNAIQDATGDSAVEEDADDEDGGRCFTHENYGHPLMSHEERCDCHCGGW